MDELLRLISVTVEDDLLYKMTFCVGGFELSCLPKYAFKRSLPFSFLLMFLKSLLCWSTFLHLPISHLSWPSCCCHLALHPQEEFWAEPVDRKCFACKIQPSPQSSPNKQTPTLLWHSWHCFLQQPDRACCLILSLWNVRSLAVGFHLSIDLRWRQDRAVRNWWGSWEVVDLDIRAVQRHSY